MTAHTQTTTSRGVLAPIGRQLAAIFVRIAENSDLHRRAGRAQRLMALSDDELARRGLRREDVLRHAFGPMLDL